MTILLLLWVISTVLAMRYQVMIWETLTEHLDIISWTAIFLLSTTPVISPAFAYFMYNRFEAMKEHYERHKKDHGKED